MPFLQDLDPHFYFPKREWRQPCPKSLGMCDVGIYYHLKLFYWLFLWVGIPFGQTVKLHMGPLGKRGPFIQDVGPTIAEIWVVFTFWSQLRIGTQECIIKALLGYQRQAWPHCVYARKKSPLRLCQKSLLHCTCVGNLCCTSHAPAYAIGEQAQRTQMRQSASWWLHIRRWDFRQSCSHQATLDLLGRLVYFLRTA